MSLNLGQNPGAALSAKFLGRFINTNSSRGRAGEGNIVVYASIIVHASVFPSTLLRWRELAGHETATWSYANSCLRVPADGTSLASSTCLYSLVRSSGPSSGNLVCGGTFVQETRISSPRPFAPFHPPTIVKQDFSEAKSPNMIPDPHVAPVDISWRTMLRQYRRATLAYLYVLETKALFPALLNFNKNVLYILLQPLSSWDAKL